MLPRQRIGALAANWIIISMWSAILGAFTFCANGNNLVIDDADIFFTYAQNLATGEGLSYSAGISRVEGYTSSLWMLISFAMFKIGFSEVGILFVSLALFVFTHLISFSILEKSVPRASWFWAKSTYLLLISLSFGYSSWMLVTLMDTTLWSAIILAAIYFLIYPPENRLQVSLGLLVFLLSALTRPESMILIPAIYILIFLSHRGLISRIHYLYLLSFLTSVALLTVFRYTYFGYPFPNTYYAKVSDSVLSNLTSGGQYVYEFFTSSLVGVFAVFTSILGIFHFVFKKISSELKETERIEFLINHKSFFFLSLLTSTYLVVVILTGGDHFNLFRMIQPIWPIMVLVLILGFFRIRLLLPGFVKPFFPTLIILILILSESFSFRASTSWLSATQTNVSPILHEFKISKSGRLLGLNLNQTFSEMNRLPNIGSITAGGISRTYEGTIFDLMGLNNAEMAHESSSRNGFRNHAIFDKEIFFNWPIDILLAPSQGWGMEVALKGIDGDDRFAALFDYGCMSNKSFRKSEVCGFFSKEFLLKTADYPKLQFTREVVKK
jgi:hypothetical protein